MKIRKVFPFFLLLAILECGKNGYADKATKQDITTQNPNKLSIHSNKLPSQKDIAQKVNLSMNKNNSLEFNPVTLSTIEETKKEDLESSNEKPIILAKTKNIPTKQIPLAPKQNEIFDSHEKSQKNRNESKVLGVQNNQEFKNPSTDFKVEDVDLDQENGPGSFLSDDVSPEKDQKIAKKQINLSFDDGKMKTDLDNAISTGETENSALDKALNKNTFVISGDHPQVKENKLDEEYLPFEIKQPSFTEDEDDLSDFGEPNFKFERTLFPKKSLEISESKENTSLENSTNDFASLDNNTFAQSQIKPNGNVNIPRLNMNKLKDYSNANENNETDSSNIPKRRKFKSPTMIELSNNAKENNSLDIEDNGDLINQNKGKYKESSIDDNNIQSFISEKPNFMRRFSTQTSFADGKFKNAFSKLKTVVSKPFFDVTKELKNGQVKKKEEKPENIFTEDNEYENLGFDKIDTSSDEGPTQKQETTKVFSSVIQISLVTTGLYTCFCGFRMFRLLMIILGFYTSYYVILFTLIAFGASIASEVRIQTGIFFGSIILGFILSAVCYMFEKLNFVILGLSVGCVVGFFYAKFFVRLKSLQDGVSLLAIILGVASLVIIAAYLKLDTTVIFGSSLIGGIITPINYKVVTGKLEPLEENMGAPSGFSKEFLAYTLIAIGMSASGVFTQLYLRKRLAAKIHEEHLHHIRNGSFIN